MDMIGSVTETWDVVSLLEFSAEIKINELVF